MFMLKTLESIDSIICELLCQQPAGDEDLEAVCCPSPARHEWILNEGLFC